MPGAGSGFGVRSRLSTAFRSDWELMWPYRFAMSATVLARRRVRFEREARAGRFRLRLAIQ